MLEVKLVLEGEYELVWSEVWRYLNYLARTWGGGGLWNGTYITLLQCDGLPEFQRDDGLADLAANSVRRMH